MYQVYVDGNPGTGFKQTGTKMWQSLTSERYDNPHPLLIIEYPREMQM
jgi:hypothetical protein